MDHLSGLPWRDGLSGARCVLLDGFVQTLQAEAEDQH
jgi:hypothetical protein